MQQEGSGFGTLLSVISDLEASYGSVAAADPEPEFFADVRWVADEYDRQVETTVVEGAGTADSILEYASDAGVDAIVMGGEGKAGVSRMLLGSVAEGVTRRASVPVTIVL
uniref:Universal stress protein n=1 Tax=Natrinema halophilum TaxID=1699371 RepID=A0A7D5L3N9_9EURY